MSDQLKVAASPIPKEILTKPDAVRNQIPSVSETTKVIKTTVKDSFGQNKPESGLDFNYQSLSARTLKLLMSHESAAETIRRLLFNSEAMRLLENGSTDNVHLTQFLENFFLSADQLPAYLKDQLSNNTLFQGNLFDFLRGLLANNGSNPQIKGSLLNVLKAMELHQNRQNTTTCLINNLNNLLPFLSTDNQQTILQCISQLHLSLQSGETQNPLTDTQKAIMSVLSDTAAMNKDNTPLRNMIMLAVHNLSRLDNSDNHSLMKTVDALIANLQQYSKLTPEQKDFLLQSVQKQLAVPNQENTAAAQVLAALDKGLAPESPMQLQLAASNLLSALLLNNSVLLPLIYGFIPLKLDNTYLFSELWAKVEEQENKKKGASGETSKAVTVFFTMESSVFGYFQGIINALDKSVDIDIEAPAAALEFLTAMKEHLKPIIADLGFQLNKLDITPLRAPKRFFDVFGTGILKEAYINVRV